MKNYSDLVARDPHLSFREKHPNTNRRTLRWIALGLLTTGGLIVPSANSATYRSTLNWTNTDSTVDANQIDRSLDGVNFTPLATVAPVPASYQDSGLVDGATYYYRVRAHSPAGYSEYSNVTAGTTPPLLVITSPADYETVTNGAIKGAARGANGLQSVTVNGQAASINGTNWFANISLAVGTNTLTVVVTDNSVDHNAVTQIVHAVLLPAPVANFTGSPTTGVAPLRVNFTDNSTGTITGRTWTFGDGTTSTTLNPSHTYAKAGTYSVRLNVSGPGGTAQLKRAGYITVTADRKNHHGQLTGGATGNSSTNTPLVMNAMAQMGGVAVIVGGEAVMFSVAATNTANNTTEYSWDFGDEQTGFGSTPVHTYAETNCQSYTVHVINNGVDSTTGTVQVATACQLDLTALQINSNFVKSNADRFSLNATVDLGVAFNPNGQMLAVDLGQAQVTFQLNRAGRGKSASGKCRLTYNVQTGFWDLTVRSKNGNWHNLWAAYNMVPGPLSVSAISVTVPVIVVVGHDAFAIQPQMQYSAATEKLGYAY